ncbi:LmbE family N-acetylglucosaminyl deacetylase/exonuclease VII small subunit [Bacillus pakistanensis]|uniref:LmbE family N-acetylglucosaminyl deacetylase/exonuclease VII small subunit n=1 Tax=Rossellomorea pakistanensis TaxID=992288 RepID=A0ABS2N731_9BACI|nr:PIG-L family deacetylase [Bacillus pakistanensis]MBM7583647.1 LmbE family N-acetylglucosaminyl deacetylase/exonuclease VII small subunit [Bacillus pakistanensis]
MRKWHLLLFILLLIGSSFTPAMAKEELQHDKELWSAVKPLDTIMSFMNTGAHPDDERSHLLAYLSRGLGVHTASIIANRGEGGQNEIGGELGNGLGIIRSREMIEASKVTGVKVFHLSETTSDEIYDFGFSKSPAETLEKWGEEVTYERFIRLIREYQPDIVMPSFLDVESQHGHHRAINQLSLKAFEDAADPNVFPEQLDEGLETWQIKKLYLPANAENATIGVEVGDYDPVYGKTYPQIGEESRYLHKSQGMGREIEPGPQTEYLKLVKSSVGDIPDKESSIFEGISYNFNEYAKTLKKGDNRIKGSLQKLHKELEEVKDAYPRHEEVLKESHEALKEVRKTIKKVNKFSFREVDKNDLLHRLEVKETQLQNVSMVASQINVKVDVKKPVLTQGTKTSVAIEIVNQGKETLKELDLSLLVPKDWEVKGNKKTETLETGEKTTAHFIVTVSDKANYYQPYEEEVLATKVTYKVGKEEASITAFPEETIAVLPEIGLKADVESLVVNTAQPRQEKKVTITATNYTGSDISTQVNLDLPEGWDPVKAQTLSFKNGEKEKQVSFSITTPEVMSNEKFSITPVATINGEKFNTTVQEISYDHIGTFYYLKSAAIEGVAFDLQFPDNLKVGYIESGFDKVADQLLEVGMDLTKITDVASEDLSQYDTIVTGIRAYLSREDLLQNNQKLLEYAHNGGHVVVQYNKPGDNWDPDTTAPFPLTIGSPSIEWRVTDEESEYNITKPDHPLLNQPNKITAQDWKGWVQERGLYYPMQWDDNYETFLTMTDLDGDQFEGGILMTDYGEGSYLYTNLVWYRQIQAQVPGGYRIFTNLISHGKNQ